MRVKEAQERDDAVDHPGDGEHVELLPNHGGNVSQAARILGVDRVTLYNKMRKYQLKKESEA